jgi:hypothetical protein
VLCFFIDYSNFAYKGTTKNAHMQVSEKLFAQKIDSIYLIRYTALAQASLKVKWWIADGKVQTIFANNFERTGVWSALSESSYGGIGFSQGSVRRYDK